MSSNTIIQCLPWWCHLVSDCEVKSRTLAPSVWQPTALNLLFLSCVTGVRVYMYNRVGWAVSLNWNKGCYYYYYYQSSFTRSLLYLLQTYRKDFLWLSITVSNEGKPNASNISVYLKDKSIFQVLKKVYFKTLTPFSTKPNRFVFLLTQSMTVINAGPV